MSRWNLELLDGLRRLADGPHATTCPQASQAAKPCTCSRSWARRMLDSLPLR